MPTVVSTMDVMSMKNAMKAAIANITAIAYMPRIAYTFTRTHNANFNNIKIILSP